MPKARIGMIGDKALAAIATEVVLDVTAMAFAARFQAYASLLYMSPFITGMFSDCRHASQNTKMLSAAMPRMMKMIS